MRDHQTRETRCTSDHRSFAPLFVLFQKVPARAIVGCGNKKASPNWYVVDTAIALKNMVLAAAAEGLGTFGWEALMKGKLGGF